MGEGENWVRPEMLNPETNQVPDEENPGGVSPGEEPQKPYFVRKSEWEGSKLAEKTSVVLRPGKEAEGLEKPELDINTVMLDEFITDFDTYYQQFLADPFGESATRFDYLVKLLLKNEENTRKLSRNTNFHRYLNTH